VGPLFLPEEPDMEACGGAVRAALEISRAQVQLGHEVWVASMGKKDHLADWHGVKLLTLRVAPSAALKFKEKRLDFSVHLPFMLLTYRNDFDIVQGHLYNYLRFLRAKIRLTHFHSDPFFEFGNNSLKQADFILIAKTTHCQIAVSDFVAGQLKRGLGDQGEIYTVYNGVDHELFSFDHVKRSEIRRLWGLNEDDFAFLFSGAFVPEKGLIHLARAFSKLSERISNAHLVLAGSQDLRKNNILENSKTGYDLEIKECLKNPCNNGKVHFLGLVSRANMPGVINACDQVVLPSICQEAFPLVALEAMSSGRSVIASRVGGLPEIVSKENGILVEPGDETGLHNAMMKMVEDTNLHQKISQQARQTATKFSWLKAAQELDTIYKSQFSKQPGFNNDKKSAIE
jgi:glycosyltransferase involved in cell wall biosynthesis